MWVKWPIYSTTVPKHAVVGGRDSYPLYIGRKEILGSGVHVGKYSLKRKMLYIPLEKKELEYDGKNTILNSSQDLDFEVIILFII